MKPRYVFGFVLVVLGFFGLLGLEIGRLIGPLFFIWLGWYILTGPHRKSKTNMPGEKGVNQDAINEVLVFTGVRRLVQSGDFRGGKITVTFSGAEFDLSGVKTKQKVINMELVSVFGSLKLRIPKDWTVTSQVVNVLGGIDNHTSSVSKSAELHITGSAVFGEIEIEN